MERRHPNAASIAMDDVIVTLSGSICTVKRGDKILAENDAPFHCVTAASDALPVYDLHADECAADCLADFLPHCGFVVLTVMDSAHGFWSSKLTNELKSMGARDVPPSYRASWCFLFQKTSDSRVCLEAYKTLHQGPAQIETIVTDETGTTDRFQVVSAGWHDGYRASIKVNDQEVLLGCSRGVNIYVQHCSRPSIRYFKHVDFCSNFIHHCAEGRHVVVATGNEKTTQYKSLPSLFYQNLTRLGGSGSVLGPSEVYMLSGRKVAAYPPVARRIAPELSDAIRSLSEHSGYVYASLLFGNKASFLAGALVLVESLKRFSPNHERILLVSEDVSETFRAVLSSSGWTIKDATFLYGCFSLIHPDNVKFSAEIFMKLHILNPYLLPHRKVLFLDLDIVVRADLSHLFDLDTPAAVSNWKEFYNEMDISWEQRDTRFEIGSIVNPEKTAFNAGVILVTPNKKLFDLLVEDIATPATHHMRTWAPEQSYLSSIFAGYLHHMPIEVNFEVQMHGGVHCSLEWSEMAIEDIKVVHFSGEKPWNAHPYDEVACCRDRYDNIKMIFRSMPEQLRQLATARAVQFSREWHDMFNDALKTVYKMRNMQESRIPVNGFIPTERMERCIEAISIAGS